MDYWVLWVHGDADVSDPPTKPYLAVLMFEQYVLRLSPVALAVGGEQDRYNGRDSRCVPSLRDGFARR